MSTLSLRLPASIHEEVKRLATREGISINQFISSAVAEKLASLTTVEHLEERARRGSRERFLATLARVPDVPADPEDWTDHDLAQYYWNDYREQLRATFSTPYSESDSLRWTRWRTTAANHACKALARALARDQIEVRDKRHGGEVDRIDVTARDSVGTLVLFESELGQPGGKEPWLNEFRQLLPREAELRVISGIFENRRAATFKDDLKNWIAPYREEFLRGPRGPFLFAFGPKSGTEDPPGVPCPVWQAYYLDAGYQLHALESDPPLVLSALARREPTADGT